MLKSFSVQQVLGAAGPANSVLFLNASGVPTGTSGLNYDLEILRFGSESYFSGKAIEATTIYITPGEGL